MEPTSPQFPISHVKVRPQSAWSDKLRHMKIDAFGQTDESRAAGEKGYNDRVGGQNFVDKIREKTPVVKINSGAKINGEDY